MYLYQEDLTAYQKTLVDLIAKDFIAPLFFRPKLVALEMRAFADQVTDEFKAVSTTPRPQVLNNHI